jgi:hypothetical protein
MRRDKQITFFDDDGVRWTVLPIPAGRVLGAGPLGLEFTSERGEQRIASGHAADGVGWQALDEPAWRALLNHALLVT